MAIDRTSKFAYVELHPRATKPIAAAFLGHLIAVVPYAIHTVLTDNGIQFANREKDRTAMAHIFGRTCRDNGIEHRTTKVKTPLDERPGGKDEPNHQASYRQALPLR